MRRVSKVVRLVARVVAEAALVVRVAQVVQGVTDPGVAAAVVAMGLLQDVPDSLAVNTVLLSKP
jgi:hypothetical protein